tara:strand:- start:162 stop:461 length:300 start_codon:yes stop_codon:yes gene_type:complete
MNRLREISEKSSGNKIYLKNVKYPPIPLDITDIYIISKDGDRLDNLANQFYKDSDLWWIISKANPNKISRDSFFIKPGLQIRIPTEIEDILEDFEQTNE